METYTRFNQLCRETIEVNETICRLRPVQEIEDQQELETLKKKLRRRFSPRLRSSGPTIIAMRVRKMAEYFMSLDRRDIRGGDTAIHH